MCLDFASHNLHIPISVNSNNAHTCTGESNKQRLALPIIPLHSLPHQLRNRIVRTPRRGSTAAKNAPDQGLRWTGEVDGAARWRHLRGSPSRDVLLVAGKSVNKPGALIVVPNPGFNDSLAEELHRGVCGKEGVAGTPLAPRETAHPRTWDLVYVADEVTVG